jgi:hypothetical protein
MKKTLLSVLVLTVLVLALALAGTTICVGLQPPPVAATHKFNPKQIGGIQWFATLDSGKAEAEKTGKPILLVAAAPHCSGISGVW